MCAKKARSRGVPSGALPAEPYTTAVRHDSHILERYELLFKATHDVIYDLDLITGKVQWNDALYDNYGYKRREPTDTIEWWTQHIHPDDALKLEAAFSDFLESMQLNWLNEYRFRLARGTYIIVRDRGYVIRSPGGKALRIIGSFLDITQERQLNRAKDEFISLASHQLKTPLSIIRTYGEMLTQGMMGGLTTDQARHVERITAAAVRLIQLVNGILNISRFELNSLSVAKSPINIARFLESAVADVQGLAHERGVALRLSVPEVELVVKTDRVLLGQIINNLLTNAIMYSPVRLGRVHISAVRRVRGCVISVRDNGIGIPEQDQQQLFSRFYRASNAINASEQGSGLGLYLVKLLTEALGGEVRFRTKVNRGTTFYLRLPMDT